MLPDSRTGRDGLYVRKSAKNLEVPGWIVSKILFGCNALGTPSPWPTPATGRGLEEAAGNNHFTNAIATLRAHALILSYTSRTGSVVTSPH